ncbi:hypothetical protein C4J81_09990 [Deltaproteobacteria bacterium Smac51]|nr:hypothetical protein C4J81_09990 [Deltaproteobacteria bacterium Smac51]
MAEYLSIEARLPRLASLELSARLMAARPHWDVEVDEEGLRFTIDMLRGQIDAELGVLEEACRQLERNKNTEITDLWVARVSEPPKRAIPQAAGPWRLMALAEGEEAPAPRPDRLVLPPSTSATARFWAGESLALSAVADHLTPPPGAPETRGRAVLVLGHILPLAPLAAIVAGAAEAIVVSDEKGCAVANEAAALNGKSTALTTVFDSFKNLAKKQEDWQGRFGLIVVHLSPYLVARRFKTLVSWLAEEGVLAVSGFAPGPQTALLLRSAAKAGLFLSGSITEGDWAAMKLEVAPAREELPPLTGSVVPALVELPPEEAASPGQAEASDEPSAEEPEMLPPIEEDEIPDEESLMMDEDEVEEDDE